MVQENDANYQVRMGTSSAIPALFLGLVAGIGEVKGLDL